jgi:hypothetical protein
MKKGIGGIVLILFVILPLFAAKEREANAGTSHEHDYYTYMEESGNIKFLVYSYLAHWRWDDEYFPLQIAVGVAWEKGFHNVDLSLGDFQLIDEDGNTYVPTPYQTINKEYKHLAADQQFLHSKPMNVDLLFSSYGKSVGAWYPVDGGGRLRTGEAELPSSTYYEDTIYFPHPQNGLDGLLTLRLSDPSIESPIEVKFRVPPHKDHKDHKEDDHKK